MHSIDSAAVIFLKGINMRVFVYFNLHRKCLSVKALEGENKGRVIAHADSVELVNVTFKVSEAGRQRVLREKRKNVHAGVVGTLTNLPAHYMTVSIARQLFNPVKYNPYKFDSFVTAVNETPVYNAKRAIVVSDNGRGAIFGDFSS
jgi:hypothetical protein